MLGFNKKDISTPAPSYTLERSPYTTLFVFLLIGAGTLGLLGLAGVGMGIVWLIRSEGFAAVAMIMAPSLVVVGVSVIIFSMGWLLKLNAEADRTRDAFAHAISREIQTTSQPAESLTKNLEELRTLLDRNVGLLREINENTLLDEAGRKRKCEFNARQERKQVYADVERLVKEREWTRAKAFLEILLEKYPETEEIHDRLAQLDTQRKAAFGEELTHTRKTINDLIAISAWDKASQLAEALVEKHPDMSAARELEDYVREERAKFRDGQIKKMYADIQKSTSRKRWNDALQIARRLIDKYPDSVEAEALRIQMETMEANAEIEKRQQLEEQIKDLVKRRNFIQAVELARYLIEQYPSSPQAVALRGQLPKLEDLARQQEKEINL